MKTAVITGCTGQDGSILCHQLLGEGYLVVGAKRRTSSLNTQRIDDIYHHPNFRVEYFDLCDASSINRIIAKYKPDEYYNLAAQSHVRTSFDVPEDTINGIVMGVLYILEAIKNISPKTRLYQASSSEMIGDNPEVPKKGYTEDSKFMPASPYGIAKVAAHNLVQNYRKSYNLHASCGILFNHECFFSNTPVILKKNNEINIDYVSSLIANRKDISKDENILTKDYNNSNIEIWDGNNFIKLKQVSRKKIFCLEEKNRKRRIVITPSGFAETTPNHKLMCGNKKRKKISEEFNELDYLLEGTFPDFCGQKECNKKFAKFLGLMCGDGHISKSSLKFINNDAKLRKLLVDLISSIYCGLTFREGTYRSGFNGTSTQLRISGLSKHVLSGLRATLYDKRTKHKKVPQIILNSNFEIQKEFLVGYNLADGLKKDKTIYEFKSFKTNSALLAQGLLFLIKNTTKQTYNINPFIQNDKIYYQINFHSDCCENNSGKHFKKESNQIKKIIEINEKNQHVYDIETETGVVMAGIGNIIVGNSEYRGETFVTRKITMGVAKIKAGIQDNLELGNLEAYRDWGYARDYTIGMWLMLQQDDPDNYVLATGKAHSVEEFVRETFRVAGFAEDEWKKYVIIDPIYFRPQEVPYLLGDSSKARKILDWKPKTTFKELVKIMYNHDLKELHK